MFWTSLIPIVLGGAALLLVFLLMQLIADRLQRPSAFEPESTMRGMPVGHAEMLSMETAAYGGPNSRRPGRRHSGTQIPSHTLRRIIQLPRPTDTVAGVRSAAVFDYTIRRHAGALRQSVPNLGGYAKIPLLLRDKMGNCVTIHRRLCLN